MILHQKFLKICLKYNKPICHILKNKVPETINLRTCSSCIAKARDLPTSNHYVSNGKNGLRDVYLWGYAVPGCLGNPDYLEPLDGKEQRLTEDEPKRLKFSEDINIIDVSCGHGFTVFAGSSGKNAKVFGTGQNHDFQIGHHATQNSSMLYVLLQPSLINLPCAPGTRVLQVDCGRSHTIIVTDREGVFSLGNNTFGQCGYRIESEQMQPAKMINRIENVRNIKSVSCGQDHTIFLNESGEVYSCGWGADGQTGLGHYKSQGIPVQLQGDIKGEKIIQVAGCSDTVLAVSDKGDLFGWGNSEYRQLKLATDEEQLNIPRYLPVTKVGKVIHAAAGGTICAIINDQGQVYVWGYGLLGKEASISHITDPYALPQNLFNSNHHNDDVKIDNISCGLNYFAAITNNGNLFMWGKNRNCRLLYKYINDVHLPFRVDLPAKVEKVSCGVDHAAVLCNKTL